MLDPKTSLAIDAPPVAPYDDGFSTDSEDYNADAIPHDSLVSSTVTCYARNAVIIENQPNIQRQHIQNKVATNASKQPSEDKPQSTAATTLETEGKILTRAADDAKRAASWRFKPQETAPTGAPPRKSVNKSEEHCRSCKGYLTPLGERLKMTRTAAFLQVGKNLPPSRQCCCCHITYPLVALTDESRSRACTQPRCYMCNWAARAAEKCSSVGAKRTVDGAVKGAAGLSPTEASKLRDKGNLTAKEIPNMATTRETSETDENCCKSCKGKLPSLTERLAAMKSPAEHLNKEQGWRVSPPSTRQCSCCFLTFPLASVTEESRSVMCAKPLCSACDGARRLACTSEEKAPTANSTQPNPEKTPEIIVVDGGEDDEEGELVEQEICQRCGGDLIPPLKRLELVKDAALTLGGKKSPPSRQCACCRVTYLMGSLTKKSRKVTRAVPICHSCCVAGGPPIYEMLCTSDEFLEAFKVEDPVTARLFLRKKEKGTIAKAIDAQRKRMMKRTKSSAQTSKTDTQNAQTASKQAPEGVAPMYKPRNLKGRLFGGPRYQLMPKKARKSMPAPRLIIGSPVARGRGQVEDEGEQPTDSNLPQRSRTARNQSEEPQIEKRGQGTG
ncbi:uncharacterized protein PITG_13663 [Phytophthora infestans T30-4]|uniref:Uncharacterized protein n=1 Tax=Phytophthora infestans (strain T30-4) TaxID=403677 RepID=D0NMI0_PHYIT|nr:uncharacterized protein PITG_13663 [Phytophthora infestans T30-4]EEY60901.1 conserved hypothetical protein [Phytophthora infestans T30-4]|eukprot:XP_002899847.1 conserved hypothetical protein [Phytophthora infestans T30-4]